MITRILAYFAKRSHNIQIQLLCATMYGLVSIFGITGTIVIIMKARKMVNNNKRSKRGKV